VPTMKPGPEQESPAAPAIPSFDSLRDPRGRTAVDLFVSGQPLAAPARTPAPAAAARPPEYADLLHLAGRLAQALAGAPCRLARWAAREPVRRLRRLLRD
jgi:hypothetical protein